MVWRFLRESTKGANCFLKFSAGILFPLNEVGESTGEIGFGGVGMQDVCGAMPEEIIFGIGRLPVVAAYEMPDAVVHYYLQDTVRIVFIGGPANERMTIEVKPFS